MTHPHALQAKHCLRQTLHKNIPRLKARSYISRYEQDPSHNENLFILAQLDFNILQSLHQEEFGNFSNWWKELDVRSKLPYARDMIVYYKPQHSMARKIMTKLFGIITVIDDTYHAFGRIDELELFTKAIERSIYTSHKDMCIIYVHFFSNLIESNF